MDRLEAADSGRKLNHLIFERGKRSNMMEPTLLIDGANRLRSHILAAGRVNLDNLDVWIDLS